MVFFNCHIHSEKTADWLQLENQLRPGQRHDAHRVDRSDRITRRPANRQYALGEGARSDLRGVTTSISAELNARPNNSADIIKRAYFHSPEAANLRSKNSAVAR